MTSNIYRTRKQLQKEERLIAVNTLLSFISSTEPRVFYNPETGVSAVFEKDPWGKIWYMDELTGKRVYTMIDSIWTGFGQSNRQLRKLIAALSLYISKGAPCYPSLFSLWESGEQNLVLEAGLHLNIVNLPEIPVKFIRRS